MLANLFNILLSKHILVSFLDWFFSFKVIKNLKTLQHFHYLFYSGIKLEIVFVSLPRNFKSLQR